jgi:hypothetical protein
MQKTRRAGKKYRRKRPTVSCSQDGCPDGRAKPTFRRQGVGEISLMTATNQEYLQRLAEYPKQAWEQAEDWVSARFHRQPERKVSKAKIAGLAWAPTSCATYAFGECSRQSATRRINVLATSRPAYPRRDPDEGDPQELQPSGVPAHRDHRGAIEPELDDDPHPVQEPSPRFESPPSPTPPEHSPKAPGGGKGRHFGNNTVVRSVDASRPFGRH